MGHIRENLLSAGFPHPLVVVPVHHPRCFHPHFLQSPPMQVSTVLKMLNLIYAKMNFEHDYFLLLCSKDDSSCKKEFIADLPVSDTS